MVNAIGCSSIVIAPALQTGMLVVISLFIQSGVTTQAKPSRTRCYTGARLYLSGLSDQKMAPCCPIGVGLPTLLAREQSPPSESSGSDGTTKVREANGLTQISLTGFSSGCP